MRDTNLRRLYNSLTDPYKIARFLFLLIAGLPIYGYERIPLIPSEPPHYSETDDTHERLRKIVDVIRGEEILERSYRSES